MRIFFKLVILSLMPVFFSSPAAAYCQKWKMPGGTPYGLPNVYCDGCWVTIGVGVQRCVCPGGGDTIGLVRMGRDYRGVCPQAAPQPQAPPAYQDSGGTPNFTIPVVREPGCYYGKNLRSILSGGFLRGRSLQSGREWTAEFNEYGRVVFSFDDGNRHKYRWSVKGSSIILRERGKKGIYGRRKICWNRRGEYFWVMARSGRNAAILLNVDQGRLVTFFEE